MIISISLCLGLFAIFLDARLIQAQSVTSLTHTTYSD